MKIRPKAQLNSPPLAFHICCTIFFMWTHVEQTSEHESCVDRNGGERELSEWNWNSPRQPPAVENNFKSINRLQFWSLHLLTFVVVRLYVVERVQMWFSELWRLRAIEAASRSIDGEKICLTSTKFSWFEILSQFVGRFGDKNLKKRNFDLNSSVEWSRLEFVWKQFEWNHQQWRWVASQLWLNNFASFQYFVGLLFGFWNNKMD